MSEVVLANVYHHDQKFKVIDWKGDQVRVTKIVHNTPVHIYLDKEKINVYSHDKKKKGFLTGKIDLILPSWLYLQYYDFFNN